MISPSLTHGLKAGRLRCLHHIDERPGRNSTKRGEFFYCFISSATSSPNFFWISFWVSGSKSVKSNRRRTSTISLSRPGMREAHSSSSSRDFTWIIQKPPTTSFVSGNGPSVTFDFPPLKVTRALIVAGGVSPSSASSTPAFPSSSLYAPIFSMSFILGTKPAFAVSYSFGNMIIMKRMVFSLSVVRTVSGPLLLYMSLDRTWPGKLPGAGRAARLHLLVERAGRESTNSLMFFRVAEDAGNRHLALGREVGIPELET